MALLVSRLLEQVADTEEMVEIQGSSTQIETMVMVRENNVPPNVNTKCILWRIISIR